MQWKSTIKLNNSFVYLFFKCRHMSIIPFKISFIEWEIKVVIPMIEPPKKTLNYLRVTLSQNKLNLLCWGWGDIVWQCSQMFLMYIIWLFIYAFTYYNKMLCSTMRIQCLWLYILFLPSNCLWFLQYGWTFVHKYPSKYIVRVMSCIFRK